jgi:hypothetical protein
MVGSPNNSFRPWIARHETDPCVDYDQRRGRRLHMERRDGHAPLFYNFSSTDGASNALGNAVLERVHEWTVCDSNRQSCDG